MKGLMILCCAAIPAAVCADQPAESGLLQPMHGDSAFAYAILNQNELRAGGHGDTYRWEGEGWYGGSLDRLWLRTEGNLSTASGTLEEGEVQALYSHAISPFFDLQTGLRYDFKPSPSRGWAAFGIHGLAPLFFELSAFGFVSDAGNYAARLEGYYDMRLTQRLVLQPQVELNAYSKSDAPRGVGAGLSGLDAGLRLRYEIRREFAPYIGVAYERKFGTTAAYARAREQSAEDLRFLAGIRILY